jgi:hypothetical protein
VEISRGEAAMEVRERKIVMSRFRMEKISIKNFFIKNFL